MAVLSTSQLDVMPGLKGSRNSSAERELGGMSVLVTDEHYKHTLGLVRHLGQKGVHVSVLAESSKSLACSTRYCHDVMPIAGPDLNAFIDAARLAVTRNRFDLVIPVGYPKTLAIARDRVSLLRHTRLELADTGSLEMAANKAKMSQLAVQLGVAAPRAYVPGSLNDVRAIGASLGYPVVVKPQRESAGHSVNYARNEKDLQTLCAMFYPPAASLADPPLLQEFIPGYGCGFFATYQNGICKRAFMHRRIREYPASGGVSTCAESFYDEKLAFYGRLLLDSMSWHGVAMVEFRCDARDGEFKLIEVNPKLWGSLDLALAAGADFPGDLCRMALGQELEFTDEYDRHLRYRWPLSISGELYHLKSRPLSLVDTILDLLNPRVKSNLWISDLGPSLLELKQLLRFLLSPKSRRA